MVEIICATIAGACAIISAVVARNASRSAKRSDARAKRRTEESRLAMDLMYANCALALVTAKKVTGHQTNGDVEEAMTNAQKAQNAYINFIRDQAAQNVSKI